MGASFGRNSNNNRNDYKNGQWLYRRRCCHRNVENLGLIGINMTQK